MGIVGSGASTPSFRRVMIFIDGGYLRKEINKMFGHDKIHFTNLASILINWAYQSVHLRGELIRVFYYDAIVDSISEPEKYKEQDQYFDTIRNFDFYEVKLGRLIRTNDSYRQKGVDVLLAIDMIKKAYEDQYEIAILVGGDDDLLDVVKAVKDAGKRVYGAFFEEAISPRLRDIFDRRYTFKKTDLENICK